MLLNHPGAGTGGGYNIVVALKRFDYLASYLNSIFAVTGIVGRLTATGLSVRYTHVASSPFHQLHSGKSNRRAKQIH